MSGDEPAPSNLELLRTRSLTTAVQEEIERQILSGELKHGERIREAQLAAKLGVSRGPVREACRSLEQLNLVRIVANRGAFVRQVSLDDAANAYDVRAALFAMAGKTLAPKITKAQIEALLELKERMRSAQRENNLEDYYRLNLRFHETLVREAGNERLHAMYVALVKELHLFRRGSLVSSSRMSSSLAEHGAIIDALAAHDAAKAGKLMERHVLAGKQHILSQVGPSAGDA